MGGALCLDPAFAEGFNFLADWQKKSRTLGASVRSLCRGVARAPSVF
jgi:hypothetical protein